MGSDQISKVEDLKQAVKAFVEERDWAKYHNPKDVAISIAIEAAELLEAFQWVKDSEQKQLLSSPDKAQSVKEELADIIIYCISLANALDLDVSEAVLSKIQKNSEKYPASKVKGQYKKYTEL